MQQEKIIYISYAEMAADVKKFCKNIEIGGVAGIPRSGALVASIIAQEKNVPLYSINELGLSCFRPETSRPMNSNTKPILIVDDTSWSGRSMDYIKNLLGNKRLLFGALYVSDTQSKKLDYFYKVLDTPFHTFEWNFLKDVLVQDFFLDFDGVLCENPTHPDNTPQYLDFLMNTPPKILPKYEISGIVTARLNKYRPQTEAWLKKHKIKYNALIMSPYGSHEERLQNHGFGLWKAEIYKQNKHIKLFVESELQQAEEIYAVTKRPVLCTDAMVLMQ